MKKMLGGGVALVAILVVAGVAATSASSASRRTTNKPKPAATFPAPTTTPTTTATTRPVPPTPTTTSTTTAPAPVDPMAGVAMLGVRGRKILGLDANGREVRTLVTAYADRIVGDAHLMGDHHTIWYETRPAAIESNDPTHNSCSDVVRLDLAANRRTVIAHADEFSVDGTGDRVALSYVMSDASCYGGPIEPIGAGIVVRDLHTGAQSTVTGEFQAFALSPGGHTLVANHCTSGPDGCHIALQRATLPNTLGAPVVLQPVNDQKLSFLNLVPRADGLYAVVDRQSQECGCSGEPRDRLDRDVSVRKFAWTDLSGPGSTLFTVQGPFTVRAVVPTPYGLAAVGQDKLGAAEELYRLDATGAHPLRDFPADTWYGIGSIG